MDSGVPSRDRLVGCSSAAASASSSERFRLMWAEPLTESMLVFLSCWRMGRSPPSLSEGGDCAVTENNVSSYNVGTRSEAQKSAKNGAKEEINETRSRQLIVTHLPTPSSARLPKLVNVSKSVSTWGNFEAMRPNNDDIPAEGLCSRAAEAIAESF